VKAPSLAEIAVALFGAWRLAHLDKSGLGYFGESNEAFWKSFFAAVLIAPGYAILIAIHLSGRPVQVDWISLLAIEGLIYAIAWVAFPLAAYHIVEALGQGARYRRYIVAYNWSQTIQLAARLPVALIVVLEVLPAGFSGFLDLAIFLLLLGYSWFIARTALEISGLQAAMLVFVDLVLGFVVTAMADGALQ